MFKSKAAGHLKIVSNGDDVDIALRVASKIVTKSKQLKRDQTKYVTSITLQDGISASSLMSTISSKLDSTLSAAMIGNIVTSAVTNKHTSLQISLGAVVREKSAIELLYDFGVTASYDEVLRFRASASKRKEHMGLTKNGGLIQSVADNFDANISSHNGLVYSCPCDSDDPSAAGPGTNIRAEISEMKEDILLDIPVQRYDGLRNQTCLLKNPLIFFCHSEYLLLNTSQ